MKGISSALVATTFVFMAVFIPVCFMGGTTGTFYTQFGLTMAVAVGISLVNSMTLSPALCALLMKPHTVGEDGKMSFSARFHVAFDAGFQGLVNRYKKGVFFMLKRRWLAWILVIAAVGGLFYMLENTKTGLVPKEDMGSINIDVQTPPGTNLGETVRVMEQIAHRLDGIEQIEAYSYTTGYGMMSGAGSSCGMFTVKLKDWDLRKEEGDDVDSVIERIYDLTSDIA